jgi:hypothetical protein
MEVGDRPDSAEYGDYHTVAYYYRAAEAAVQ